MMQMYMKLMNHPETKDLMADPTFMPILQTIMTNPQEMFKYMGDPRVQKILKVLQESVTPEQAEKAASFMNKQGGGMPGQSAPGEPMKEEKPSYSPPPPPPPKKEQPKPQKMDIEDPAEQAKAKGNEQFKKKNFNEANNYYEEAIQLNPNEPLYYNNKAAAYIELGEI